MKPVHAYIYLAKMKLMITLVYRFEVIASVMSSAITMLSTIFLWKTVYHAIKNVDNFNEKQMITYAIISALLGMVFTFNVEKVLYDRVFQGDIAIDFFRPASILLCYFAEDVGSAISALMCKFIPMTVVIVVFFVKPGPASPLALVLFIVSSVLSYGILWLIDAIVGVFHFKSISLGNIGYIKNVLVSLLSGSIIPIWFFPEKIRNVLRVFPFQYTYQTPIGIYIGTYDCYDAVFLMMVQCLWVCILFIVLHVMWNRTSKNILIQGG